MINIAVIYRYEIKTFDIFFFSIPFSQFSLEEFSLESNRRVLRILWIRSPIWDRVVCFVVERVGRIIELNEEATFSFPFYFRRGTRNVAAQFHVSASSRHES